jgi:hypothetical protein
MISPNLLSAVSLESAWAQALKVVLAEKEVAPLVVTFATQQMQCGVESMAIRVKLDEVLESKGKFSCSTVANTIFPMSLWDPSKEPERLYLAYLSMLPVLWKFPQNRRGLYFERLIDYGNGKNPGSGINQLAHVTQISHLV